VKGGFRATRCRADIDYGTAEANTTFGVIGIKVWIYLGEVLPGQEYHAQVRRGGELERWLAAIEPVTAQAPAGV
jgi:ribosomal protein S3